MTPSSAYFVFIARRRESEAETSAFEGEFDRHVYALDQPSPRPRPAGGLTPDEIKFVENSTVMT